MRFDFAVRLRLLLAITSLFCAAGPAARADDLTVSGTEIEANRDIPEVCFRMNQTLARRPASPLEQAVQVEPKADIRAIPRKERLCLTGLLAGRSYAVTLKAGLAGVGGALAKDAIFRVVVPTRPPELSFAAPETELLPRAKLPGLPVRSVNVAKIDVAIFRIPDRDVLTVAHRAPLTGTDLGTFVPERGERVWQGSLSPQADPNRDALTILPLDKTIGAPKPGLYVAVAWPTGEPVERTARPLPTQYFTVSDIGLAAFRSRTSLLVSVRSLATAIVAPGVDIALVGRNNRELGRAKSDDNGLVRFEGPAMNGTGGDTPIGVLAYGSSGDFSFLRLPATTEPDRNGSFAIDWRTNRAVYRPLDTVRLTVLLRTRSGGAAPKGPLHLDIRRPDGSLYAGLAANEQAAGAYTTEFLLPSDAQAGNWMVNAFREDGDAPIGSDIVRVASSADPTLTVNLSADSALLEPGQPATVAIQTQSSDGQPIAAPGEFRVQLARTIAPFPGFPGYVFGTLDEVLPDLKIEPVKVATDTTGKAYVPLKLPALGRVGIPVEARVTAGLLDTAGRTVEQQITVPVATQSFVLGIKLGQNAAFPEAQPTRFEVIALSPDGARQDRTGIGWEVLREEPSTAWHPDSQGWSFRPILQDRHVTGGTIDVGMGDPAIIDPSLPAGRYRLEVFDPAGETLTGVRFQVGSATAIADPSAQHMEIRPAKPAFIPSEPLEFFVRPPYEADILLVAADGQIRTTAQQHIGAAGGTIRLEIPADAGSALDIAVMAFAGPEARIPDLPRRAFQHIVVPRDPALHRLSVKLTVPSDPTPGKPLTISGLVDGAGDEPAYVRLTADDARVSDATDPSGPETFSVGGEMMEVADLYHSVISSSGLALGRIEPATPIVGVPLQSSPPAGASLSLSSPPIAIDKTGRFEIPLAVPDNFRGPVRIGAVAWSASRQGTVQSLAEVRQPLDLDIQTPRTLRPDDRVDLVLGIDNARGPRGEYKIAVSGEGSITVSGESSWQFNLAEGEQRQQPLSISASGSGPGRIILSVSGPNGIAFEHRVPLTVTAAGLARFRHVVVQVKPGASLQLDAGVLAGLQPDTTRLTAFVTGSPAIDVASLAEELSLLQPMSVETIVARALPCAFPDTKSAIAADDKACLADSAARLLAQQRSDGSFTRFGQVQPDLWTTALAIDLLARIDASGAASTGAAVSAGLDWLGSTASPPVQGDITTSLAKAYADFVLARGGRLSVYDLRSVTDRLAPQESPGVFALFGAALAAAGDKTAATDLFDRAMAAAGTQPKGSPQAAPAGSAPDLHELALVAAVIGESGAASEASVASAAILAATAADGRRGLSAEDAAWLYRAGIAAPPPAGAFKIKAGDQTVSGPKPFRIAVQKGSSLPALRNTGAAPIFVSITAAGVPGAGEWKEAGGPEIESTVFDLTGKPVDPNLGHKGDTYLVVISGRVPPSADAIWRVDDPVPAGWVVDSTTIINPGERYPWLKDLTGTDIAIDRGGVVTALPRPNGERRDFRFAYVVRAIARGQFSVPGAVLEDTRNPASSTFGTSGRIRIDASP